MQSLIGTPAFDDFIDEVRLMRDAAMLDACSDKVVANERLSLAALGEVRAYTGLIDCYDSYKESLDQRVPASEVGNDPLTV